MRIHSEIKLFKPSSGTYVPGCVVSGAIKYTVQDEIVFDKITLSLEGKGYVNITDETARGRDRGISAYRDFEDFLNMENIIYNNEKGTAFHIGSYKTSFSFQLPQDIPASLEYQTKTAPHRVRSKIAYFICIKFVTRGSKKFAQKFEKEFTVISRIKPKLSTEPIIHSEQRKLFQLFGGKNCFISIMTTIDNSVIRPGGQVKFNYEIRNETNLCIKSIETNLIEMYTFKCKGHANVEICDDIIDTDTKTGAIKSGNTLKDSVVINVPSNRTSLEFSKIVARDYFVCITAHVPFPHRNVVFRIPIQVGYKIGAFEDVQNVSSNESPPSYWQAMGEDSKKCKNN